MGDISEVRILVTIFSFIGVFVLLIGFMPAAFLISEYEGRTVTPPEGWESGEMLYFADMVNQTLDDSGYLEYGVYYYPFDLGGHNLEIYDFASFRDVRLIHYWYWWIFPTGHHSMEWFNDVGISRGTELLGDELNLDYSEADIRYKVVCDHVNFYAFFSFNETAYSSPSDAWGANEINIRFGIEFDQVNTSVNAWSLISMLLFFGLPSVSPIINAIIAIPIWIAIAYVSYILILRAIGAVFGGGGA